MKESRTSEQTRTMLGVNSEQKESMQHYISDSIYGLTLAWITSENSTKQLGCRHLDSVFFAGPYLMLARLSARVSGVTAPVRGSTPTFSVRSFLQPTLFSRPVTSSGHAEISSPKTLCRFRAKTDKGIVCLAGHPYSVTTHRNILIPIYLYIYIYSQRLLTYVLIKITYTNTHIPINTLDFSTYIHTQIYSFSYVYQRI